MAKVLVLGAGPAGISAALYARRGGAGVLVIHRGTGTGALGKAEMVQNYYGLEQAVPGAEFVQSPPKRSMRQTALSSRQALRARHRKFRAFGSLRGMA